MKQAVRQHQPVRQSQTKLEIEDMSSGDAVHYPSVGKQQPIVYADPPHRSEVKKTVDGVLKPERQRPSVEIDLGALLGSSENVSYLLEKVKIIRVGSTAQIPLRMRVEGVPNNAVLAVDSLVAPSSDFCFTVPAVPNAEVNRCILKRSQQEIDNILATPLIDQHTLNRVVYSNQAPDMALTLKNKFGARIEHIPVKAGTPEHLVVSQYLLRLSQYNLGSVIQQGGDLLVDKQNVKEALEEAFQWYTLVGPKNTLKLELDHDGNTFITEPNRPGALKSAESKSVVNISMEITWVAVSRDSLRKLSSKG